MRGAEAAVSDVLAALVLTGERPEIRAVDAALAIAEPVELLDLEAGPLGRPDLHLVQTIERKRVDCACLPVVERSPALRDQDCLPIQRLAVAEIGGKVRVRFAIVKRGDDEPWNTGPGLDGLILRFVGYELPGDACDKLALVGADLHRIP